MNRSFFKFSVPSITGIAALLLTSVSLGITPKITSTFSGRVVDVEGNPVAELPLTMKPIKLINGYAVAANGDFPIFPVDKSDEAGHFFITHAMSCPVQLIASSSTPQESQKSYELLSMKIGTITVYPTVLSHTKGIKLLIEPGTQLENVKITVRPRTRYRGLVVSKDGTLFKNAQINLHERSEYKNGMTSTETKKHSPTRTNSEGYFVRYVDEPNFEVASYKVSVKCQGLSASSEFTLKSGEQREDLVFTLQETSMSMRGRIVFEDGTALPKAMFELDVCSASSDENSRHHSSREPVTDYAGYFIEYLPQPGVYVASVEYQGLSATSKFTVKFRDEREEVVFTLNDTPIWDMMGLMAPTVPNMISVWIGAPNGSSYKSIRSSSWKDAQTKALAEGAELVSINDKAEQEWLVEHFGFNSYWIGLTYSVEADEWQWNSGEPFAYTNWMRSQPAHTEAESYGSMGGNLRGQWRVHGQLEGGESSESSPRAAILEKRLVGKAPLENK